MRSGPFLFAALIALAIGGPATLPAAAQSYPSRPIKVIVPFPAGGPIDSIGRLIGQHMTAELGQSIVLENRPGAGGTLGANIVANAPPDGHTLLMGSTTTLSISPHLYKNIGYDPEKGLVLVATVSTGAMVLVVSPKVPVSSVKELIAYAKAHPGTLNYGAGTASPPHLAGALFKEMTGTNVVFVPYRGAAPAIIDLLAGQIQFEIDAIGTLKPHVDSGKLKALAVTGEARDPAMPNVPTMIEAGVAGYNLDFWTGVAVAAGTPPDVITKLNTAINKALGSADVQAAMTKFSIAPKISTPQQATNFMEHESKKWGAIVKQAGVQLAN